ncbi:hypothetical protein FH972_018040 [Carpinus fangiana]|uniref:Transmembrane protein n=1 Tax=Carpinus fangiana TaxID=176857 RepID=A0A5N6RM59_9ROSI|nr:hypothetical protein FH972_018040 [Carpinus fangiana]
MKHFCRMILLINSIFTVIFLILLLSSTDHVEGFRPLMDQYPPTSSINSSFAAEAYSSSGPSRRGIGHK